MSLNRNELLRLVSAQRDIVRIKTEDNIINTDSFRQLISVLVNFSSETLISSFAFHFKEDELGALDFVSIKHNLINVIKPQLNLKNFFLVNNKLEVLNSELYRPVDSIDAKETYKQLSRNKHCVVLIFDKVHSIFFDGIELTTSIFLAEADFKKWVKKKDISDLHEVIEEYKVYLKEQSVYHQFFADKAIMNRLSMKDGIALPKNLLRNKPEGVLRDNLKNFLQDRISRTFNFSRESLLNSDKRLDITTEDEQGDYYFLEIKWVGRSINSTATSFGKTYGDDRPQEGMLQTYEYIHELTEMKKNVRLGCLIVFDARDVKTAFVYDTSKIPIEWRKFSSLYKTIDDLHLDNVKPH